MKFQLMASPNARRNTLLGTQKAAIALFSLPRFGRDTFNLATGTSQSATPESLVANMGKTSGLNGLTALHTRYPNLTYHGSPIGNISTLQPRQACWRSIYNEYIPDGHPAVVTLPDFRASLFHALLKPLPTRTAQYIDNRDGSLVFKVDMTPAQWSAFKQDKNQTGFVYVLNPDGMTVYRQIPPGRYKHVQDANPKLLELRSEKPVVPLAAFPVTRQDLLDMLRNDQSIRLQDWGGQPLSLD